MTWAQPKFIAPGSVLFTPLSPQDAAHNWRERQRVRRHSSYARALKARYVPHRLRQMHLCVRPRKRGPIKRPTARLYPYLQGAWRFRGQLVSSPSIWTPPKWMKA